MNVKTAIESGNVPALQQLLAENPAVANERIRWGKRDEIESSPLHFLCDKVFDGTISGSIAAELARTLISAQADIEADNGDPLNAAASLGATEVGLLLLEAGARTDQRGNLGETALHWAAILGDSVLTRHLLDRGAPLHVRDARWNATPLGWARHGWNNTQPPGSKHQYREVVDELVRRGAVE